MGPKRGTKAYREEAVQVFYAVDRETLEVVAIMLSRERVLSMWRGDVLVNHAVLSGRLPEAEIGIVWGMTGVHGAMIGAADAEQRARQAAQDVADKMRAEAQSKT